MRTLNLGIVAHVDAGKTSLTERLLHVAGVIDHVGRVDHGDTQTDTLALERQRGITIRSAVVSFELDDVTVNLLDTPGHPDFIAEVERVLGVLDGAVLVLSAVEGVQAQTRVLFRTLQRLEIPTLLFVNKIDRRGARGESLLVELARRLCPNVLALTQVDRLGSRTAAVRELGADDHRFVERLTELVADHDDAILADYLDDEVVAYDRVRRGFEALSRRGVVHPVLFGSAMTGVGIDVLTRTMTELLPADVGDQDAQVSGTVFKIERDEAGRKRAFVRSFAGTLRTRERIELRGQERKVTAIRMFSRGGIIGVDALEPGRIGLVDGLGDVRIGDAIGVAPSGAAVRQFAAPSLEAIVDPCEGAHRGRLLAALTELAKQDPLIDLRQDDVRQEIHVSLYGEVQKEVVQATLAAEYGLEVRFRETTTLCVERPLRVGAAVEHSPPTGRTDERPFLATVGLRVAPGPYGGGVRYERATEVLGTMPAALFTAIEETVPRVLQQGLAGWPVTDVVVTLTHTGYWPRQSASHGTFDRAMSSTASDFRNLTPLVLMQALRRAGTAVCQPIHRFALEVPSDTISTVVSGLASAGAIPHTTTANGATARIDGEVPAGRLHGLQQRLPGWTRGEGLLESELDRFEPVTDGPSPRRPRTDDDPLDRKAYLLRVARRV